MPITFQQVLLKSGIQMQSGDTVTTRGPLDGAVLPSPGTDDVSVVRVMVVCQSPF